MIQNYYVVVKTRQQTFLAANSQREMASLELSKHKP